ncbi:MAG: hypothetical protein AAF420_11640, partial [Pseudomonadota bacterium]
GRQMSSRRGFGKVERSKTAPNEAGFGQNENVTTSMTNDSMLSVDFGSSSNLTQGSMLDSATSNQQNSQIQNSKTENNVSSSSSDNNGNDTSDSSKQ